jgi:inner membrane protein
MGERAALLAGVGLTAGFVLLQGAMAGQAREALRTALRQTDPSARILDLPLSAFPANPLCWSAIAVTREGDDGYRIRRGVLSLAPGITPAASCPRPIAGVRVAAGPAPVAWAWEEQGSVAALRERMAHDCRFAAWLRFARAPSLAQGGATDVRFGIPGTPNFSTLPLATGSAAPCPGNLPQWGHPRADLLGLH